MKIFILNIVVLFLVHSATAITYKYMNLNCGGDIDLGFWDSVRLKYSSSSFYSMNQDCTVRVKTSYGDRIMLYFKNFDIRGTSGICSSDWLDVRNGDSSVSSSYVSGLSGRQCGSYMSSIVRRTSGPYMYLHFKSGSSSFIHTGFDMILTSYHTGVCYSYEYECSNGRCIDNSVACNGYNPCGDYSDCSYGLAGGSIAGIVVGSIFFVVILTIVLIVFRRRRIAYIGQQVHQPVNVVTTSTGYNQPLPQQYPGQAPTGYPVGQQYPNKQYQ